MIEIDGYADVERIGRGGLGDVYRATRVSTGRTVAIKVLRDVSDESVAWHRTRRELTALVALAGHAHVVQLLELLELEQGPALVMEYAPGGSVAGLLERRGGTLTVAEVVLVGRHTAAALVAAHARGIVHRDIKPQNLLIDAYGQVRLCDFGIAALTRSEEFVARTNALSMRYASPEDLDHEDDVGPPADLYSLGATLLHLAHGAPPTIRERIAPWVPPPTEDADLAALDAVIAACLHPVPGQRPRASQVLDDLERLGWSVDERQRALALDPPSVSVLRLDDEPTAPSAGQVARGPAPDDDPTVHRPPPPSVEPEDVIGDPTGDTRRPPGRPLPPRPAASAHRRAGDRSRAARVGLVGLVGLVVVVIVVVVVGGGVIRREATDDVGPADADPSSTVASTRAVSLDLVERPAGLPDLTDPDVVWPFGPVGDCLVQLDGRAELVTVACDEPHDLQRFAVAELDPGRFPAGAEYDANLLRSEALAACAAAFEPFVGIPYDDSELEAPFTVPSAATWADGDRSYQCLLYAPGRRLVGDASAR